MKYIREMSRDMIFSSSYKQTFSQTPANDSRYDKQLTRTYCFKTFLEDAYAVIDGIPLPIPRDDNFNNLRQMINIKQSEEGVFIIKSFRYSGVKNIYAILRYWDASKIEIPTNIKNDIRTELIDNIKGYASELTFRLVEFISYRQLVNSDIKNHLLNGMVSLSLNNPEVPIEIATTIKIELSGEDSNQWMVIGDAVFPIIASKKFKESKITIGRCGSTVAEHLIEDHSLYNIYPTKDIANDHRTSTSFKSDKHTLEKIKLDVEAKKVTYDAIKLRDAKELAIETNNIQFRSEIIKLLISENLLKQNEMNNIKSIVEGGIKVLLLAVGMAKKIVNK